MSLAHTASDVKGQTRSARRLNVTATRVLILAGLLLIWEVWLRLAGDTIVIAPPSSIVNALFTQVLPDPEIRGAILLALLEVVAAYALAIVGGLAVGLAVGATNF